jgi:hypothetical protein
LQHAEEQVKRNLATREERFLALVRSQVYERPGSPYLKLFKIAGCEFSDLQADVRRYGLKPNLNEEHLLRRLEEELSKGRWGNRFQTGIWRDAGTLRIKREAPHASLRGKILPLHIDRSASSGGLSR